MRTLKEKLRTQPKQWLAVVLAVALVVTKIPHKL